MREELGDDGGMARPRSDEERRPVNTVHRLVDGGAALEQQPRDRLVALLARHEPRRNIRVVTVVDTMTPNLRDMKIQGV